MDDEDLEIMHALAFFYWRRNQNERAAALAYAGYQLSEKNDVRLACLLSLALLDLGFPDRSLATLEGAARISDPNIARSARNIRARAFLRLGKLEEARKEFRLGAEISRPQDPVDIDEG